MCACMHAIPPSYIGVFVCPVLLQERILKHKYRSLADMEDDMLLLCTNARQYNKETSQIYIDSRELEQAFLASRAALGSEGEGFKELRGVYSEDEEEERQMTVESSRSSSAHVVEVEGYASDNSDGKYIHSV